MRELEIVIAANNAKGCKSGPLVLKTYARLKKAFPVVTEAS